MRGRIGENIFFPTKYYSTLLWLPQKPAIFRLGMIYGNVTRGALQSIARAAPHAPLPFVWEWKVERNPDSASLLIGLNVCNRALIFSTLYQKILFLK
jgi:hypothetical protein